MKELRIAFPRKRSDSKSDNVPAAPYPAEYRR
jgi:hypothetical protein